MAQILQTADVVVNVKTTGLDALARAYQAMDGSDASINRASQAAEKFAVSMQKINASTSMFRELPADAQLLGEQMERAATRVVQASGAMSKGVSNAAKTTTGSLAGIRTQAQYLVTELPNLAQSPRVFMMSIGNQITSIGMQMQQTGATFTQTLSTIGKSFLSVTGVIGLVVTAITLLVNNWDKLTEAIGFSNKEIKNFTDNLKAYIAWVDKNATEGINKQREAFETITEDYVKELELQGKSEQEILKYRLKRWELFTKNVKGQIDSITRTGLESTKLIDKLIIGNSAAAAAYGELKDNLQAIYNLEKKLENLSPLERESVEKEIENLRKEVKSGVSLLDIVPIDSSKTAFSRAQIEVRKLYEQVTGEKVNDPFGLRMSEMKEYLDNLIISAVEGEVRIEGETKVLNEELSDVYLKLKDINYELKVATKEGNRDRIAQLSREIEAYNKLIESQQQVLESYKKLAEFDDKPSDETKRFRELMKAAAPTISIGSDPLILEEFDPVLDSYLEAYRRFEEELLALRREYGDKQISVALENADKMREFQELDYQRRIEYLAFTTKGENQLVSEATFVKLQIAEQYTQAITNLADTVYRNAVDNANKDGKITKEEEKRARKAFEVQKGASASAAAIQTALGAISAYQSLSPIPIVGPALGAAAAAATAIFGATQVASILSQQYTGPTMQGGAQISLPDVSLPSVGEYQQGYEVETLDNPQSPIYVPVLITEDLNQAMRGQRVLLSETSF